MGNAPNKGSIITLNGVDYKVKEYGTIYTPVSYTHLEYTNRKTTGFVARSEVGSESSLLQILNTKTGTTYSNLIDWIAGKTTGLIHEKVVFTNNTVMN